MNCPRHGCHGLLVPETVYDGSLALDLMRCVSCGRMGKADEQLASDQTTAKEEREMPRAWTPERREKFRATMAAKKGRVVVRRTVDRAVEPVVHDAVSVEREPLDFSALDVVIDRTRQDLEALERTREILERRRAV